MYRSDKNISHGIGEYHINGKYAENNKHTYHYTC